MRKKDTKNSASLIAEVIDAPNTQIVDDVKLLCLRVRTYEAWVDPAGKKLYIEGRLQTRSWETDSGKRYKTEIVGESLLMLSGGEAPSAPKSEKASPEMADEIFIDDFPF